MTTLQCFLFSTRLRFLCLIIVATMMNHRIFAKHSSSLIRVENEDDSPLPSTPSTVASPWMNDNTNMSQEGFLAVEGCECTCDCLNVSKTVIAKDLSIEECSCSCKCDDPANEAIAEAKSLLRQDERARVERERLLRYEREMKQQGSFCNFNCRVIALKLWNAQKDTPIRTINDGDVVCRPRIKVNFEAILESNKCAESVVFRGSFGKHTENQERYFQFGDYRGDIFGKLIRAGRYLVRVRPYSQDNGKGHAGKETVIRFRVVECPKKERQLELQDDDAKEDGDEELMDKTDTMTSYEYDFAVFGLPGGGSSHLLQVFTKHNETSMLVNQEICNIVRSSVPDAQVEDSLDEALENLIRDHRGAKYSFSCPTALFDHRTISRMEKHSAGAKLIIGLPHPIFMLENLYNSRVSEAYDHPTDREKIRSFDDVIASSSPWKDVSLVSTRFEMFLLQLAKTSLLAEDMETLAEPSGYHLAIRPNKFSVFLYAFQQLQDINETRSTSFRQALQTFLDLSSPLPDLRASNDNFKPTMYPESISICDAKWASLRADLLSQASHTAEWIINRFIKSRDVHVANVNHFVQMLKSWELDPCGGALVTTK